MTHTFTVGETVPSYFKTADLKTGEARAFAGIGGFEVVLRVDEPTADHVAAVEHGPVGLGVQDRRGAESVLLLQVGERGGTGHAEAVIDIGPAEWKRPQRLWDADVELALCDASGVCRARREFVGPGIGLQNGERGAPEEVALCVAVFPADRYGLVQPRGRLGADSWVAAGRAVLADPDWRPGFTEVWDLRFADETVLHPSDMGRLMSLELETKQDLSGSRTLIVVPRRRALTFSARLYAKLMRPLGRSIVVCKTEQEAAELLGIGAVPTLVECEQEG
ncbi:hypothetical protein RQM47_16310 [Rubrivirga sp. S365]|uniref:hypothetical protein n=1 Tax=Rubrivirga sp. S365 TaxID=3076080 RepID=UPI0028C9F263|nr:hypothetical protein [Rubrivirga sp. S365]MDT7858213.1 hypothetical protein [Rubrivirga sp. S365]